MKITRFLVNLQTLFVETNVGGRSYSTQHLLYAICRNPLGRAGKRIEVINEEEYVCTKIELTKAFIKSGKILYKREHVKLPSTNSI